MTPESPVPELPSRRRLLTTTAIALGIAVIVLVTVVLPAEYGIDPLHTGAALGLTALSAPVAPPAVAPPNSSKYTPALQGPVAFFGTPWRQDAAEFTLGPYEYIEYKYRLEKGAAMLFAWTSSLPVVQDFHGKADAGQAETSYDRKVRTSGDGSLTAPFTGIHGWYWENPGDNRITVKLTSAGFYSSATEFRMNRKTFDHKLNGENNK